MVQPQHAVGACRRRFGVRHQHAGRASAADLAGEQIAARSSAVSGSRLPVGSSASTSAGRCTSARATATRCSSPPDKLARHAAAAVSQPDGAEQRGTRARPARRGRPRAGRAEARRSGRPSGAAGCGTPGTRSRASTSQQRARGVVELREVGAFDLDAAGLGAVEAGDQVEQRGSCPSPIRRRSRRIRRCRRSSESPSSTARAPKRLVSPSICSIAPILRIVSPCAGGCTRCAATMPALPCSRARVEHPVSPSTPYAPRPSGCADMSRTRRACTRARCRRSPARRFTSSSRTCSSPRRSRSAARSTSCRC